MPKPLKPKLPKPKAAKPTVKVTKDPWQAMIEENAKKAREQEAQAQLRHQAWLRSTKTNKSK